MPAELATALNGAGMCDLGLSRAYPRTRYTVLDLQPVRREPQAQPWRCRMYKSKQGSDENAWAVGTTGICSSTRGMSLQPTCAVMAAVGRTARVGPAPVR